MKKKILSIALVVCLLATALVSGTLAYFTDADKDVNVMTSGNVQIVQNETKKDGTAWDEDGVAHLVPAVDTTGELDSMPKDEIEYGDYDILVNSDGVKNVVDKVVTVTNKGSEDAYVRTFVIIEDNHENAAKLGVLSNINADLERIYTWGYFEEKMTMEFDGVNNGKETEFTVFVYTYAEPLVAEETSAPSLLQVWMSPDATNDDAKTILGDDNNLTIIAFSQAVQAAGFETAQDAFDAAFGTMDELDAAKLQGWVAAASCDTLNN